MIGIIIAVVAVLDIHMDSNMVVSTNPNISLLGLCPETNNILVHFTCARYPGSVYEMNI